MLNATIAQERFGVDRPHRAATAGGTDASFIAARTQVEVSQTLSADSIARYVEGWAEGDPGKIIEGTAPGFVFDDPLVGAYSRLTLGRYFRLLEARFALPGAAGRLPCFILRGPMDGRLSPCDLTFWREAPELGLTGISRILVGARGVLVETVAYDLSPALEQLRRVH